MKKTETAFCENCNKHVAYHFNPVNHAKQAFLVVFTLGLWLPVWLCMVYCPTKMCDACNGPIWAVN